MRYVNAVLMKVVLELGIGSVTPPGTFTLAILVREVSVPPTGMRAWITIVMAPLAGKVGTVPETEVAETDRLAGHAAPLMATVHVAETLVRPAGRVSTKVAPLAALGPTLEIDKTYVIVSPFRALGGPFFEILRSAI